METTIDILKRYFDKKAKSSFAYQTQTLPFITVSRETGAADIRFLKDLLQAINETDTGKTKEWIMFGKESLGILINDKSITKSIDEYLPEQKIPELQAMLEQLFGVHSSIQKIVKEVSHSIMKIALMGETILIGRGANHITKHFHGGLHIRFIASMNQKISDVQKLYADKFENFDFKNAKKYIEEIDKNKREYIKKNFSEDIAEPLNYSLIINLSKLTEKETINIICRQIIEIRNNLKINKHG